MHIASILLHASLIASNFCMHTVQESITAIESKIRETRKRASHLRFWGGVFRGPACFVAYFFGAASLTIGFLEGAHTASFLGSYPLYRPWLFLTNEYPAVWKLLSFFSPSITFSPDSVFQPTSIIVWTICWVCWIASCVWLGKKALAHSIDLRKQADADENTLRFQEPTWRQLEILTQVQSSSISGISGNANTINAINQINNILQRQDENKGWWTRPFGLFIIGLAINIISKAI